MENKEHSRPIVSIIVAMARNRAIGRNGTLPWHLPEDLAHFKSVTWGHTIIMGRHTFESLPHGALPGRRNIVVSSTLDSLPNCEVCHSLDEALGICSQDYENINTEEVFIIGGAKLYRAALPLANRMYITLVDQNPKDADTFFPEFNTNQWHESELRQHDGFAFTLWNLKKKHG